MPDDVKMNWDAEKGTVTLVKDEDTKTFDLSNENDRVTLMKMGQRGWYYDEVASKELGQLRTVVNNWDKTIEAAKKDDKAMQELVGKLEMAIGRPLTNKEEKDLDKGKMPKILLDEEEDSNIKNMFKQYEAKITELEKKLNQFAKGSEDKELAAIQAEIEKEAIALEKKYDGKDGTPKFERDEIYKFAAEKGIDDLELAFKMMNLDKLTEAAQKKAIAEYQDQLKKRKAGFVESSEESAAIESSHKSNAKTYHQLGHEAFESAKKQGISFFNDD